MAKVMEWNAGSGEYAFYCEGCGNHHLVFTKKPNQVGAKWEFNGNKDKPTFTPSILIRIEYLDPHRRPFICHSFVKDGNIQYLNDCTHKLAGKTVPLSDAME